MSEFSAIKFPGLGLEINPSDVAFRISGHDIRWYGLIIAVGAVLAIVYAMLRARKFGFTIDDLVDILIVSVPFGIIGARLYFVVFYDLEYYMQNPIEIFYIWNGGLAIYGGIIGGMLAAAVTARIKRIKALAVLDLGAIALPLAQAIGRWGNLINREAYGSSTELPWRMVLYKSGEWVTAHPCFLYESLWNLAGFILLHFMSAKRKFDGQMLLLYAAWYGLGRAFIEGLRTDSLFIGGTGLRVSQMLAIATCVAALALLVIFTFFIKPSVQNSQVERFARKQAKLALKKAADSVTTEHETLGDEPIHTVEEKSEEEQDI